MSVSVSVCLSVRDHVFGTTRLIFTEILCLLPMAMARSSSGGVYVMYRTNTALTVICVELGVYVE